MSDNSAFAPSGDPDQVFLAEVARLMPDVDVVAMPAPRPSGQPVPADEVAEATMSSARETVVGVVRELWAGPLRAYQPPDRITTMWTATELDDAVAAEARCRTEGEAFVVRTRLDEVCDQLVASGWQWVRSVQPDDTVRLRAGRDGVSVDIAVRPAKNVVMVRARSLPVLTGSARAHALVAEPPGEITP